MYRDAHCGKFTEEPLGNNLKASGWVKTKRDVGDVIFLDLSDTTGVLQVVFNLQNLPPARFPQPERPLNQSGLGVEGVLAKPAA